MNSYALSSVESSDGAIEVSLKTFSLFLSSLRFLAHPVYALALGGAVLVLALEVVVNLNIEITAVLRVGLDAQDAVDLLALLDGEDVLQVENRLLPVGVLSVGTSREADRLVASSEVNVKPGNQGVDVVVTLDGKLEVGSECQVSSGASVEVQVQDSNWVGDNSLDLDGVDQRLRQSSLFQRGVVETIDVVPN